MLRRLALQVYASHPGLIHIVATDRRRRVHGCNFTIHDRVPPIHRTVRVMKDESSIIAAVKYLLLVNLRRLTVCIVGERVWTFCFD